MSETDKTAPPTQRISYENYQPARHILDRTHVPAQGLPKALVTPLGEVCPTCGASTPGIKDLLLESAGWISDLDGAIVAFYQKLLDLAREAAENDGVSKGWSEAQIAEAGEQAVQDLAFLFPADLLTAAEGDDSRGAGQRDKLAKALVALASTYDPADDEKMTRLDTVIKSMGHRHAAFARRNGTIQGATWDEYGLAKKALMFVLGTLGDRFTAEHAEAWSQAYDYAASGMIQVQLRSGALAPRFPAPSKP